MSRSPLAAVRGFPREFRDRYRELGHWTDETFAQFVTTSVHHHSARPAVVAQDTHGVWQHWTYAEFGARIDRAAGRFQALGIVEGDRVVVALPNVAEYLETVLGLFRLGALPVFALPSHRELELTRFCALTDAAALVSAPGHDALYAAVRAQLRERDLEPPLLVDVSRPGASSEPLREPVARADQVAFLQLSGGTTGVSKLIPRTHADYLYSVRESARICEYDETTRMLVALPAAHNFPMSSPGILGVMHAGGTVVMAPDPSPRTAFRLVEEHRVTDVALVPPLAQAWISAARRRRPDLSSLRTVLVGGSRLPDTVAPDVRDVLGARLCQVFGMAEGLVCYTRPDDPEHLVLTTQGTPISPDDELRVVDEDDRDTDEGSLLVRGPYTIRGYYRSPQADAECFTDDGFYRTGDLVRRLPSGHLVVTGRVKDQINRAGEKIATAEIEGLALSHPDVLDAVAVGVPDAYLGERVALVVRAETGRPRPDLVAHLRDLGLATYKIPDDVVFQDRLPETHVGKNSRRELRRLLAETLKDPR